MRLFVNIQSKYSSLTNNINYSFNFFLLTALLVFLVFGLFGIRFSYVEIFRKNQEVRAAKQEIVLLEAKEAGLSKLHEEILTLAPYRNALDTLIPVTSDYQNYLSEIVMLSSSAGYSVSSFRPVNSGDGNTFTVNISFSGNPYKVSRLIDAIQKTQRISNVQKVGFSADITDSNISIDVNSYFMNKLPIDFLGADSGTIDIDYLKKVVQPAHERN